MTGRSSARVSRRGKQHAAPTDTCEVFTGNLAIPRFELPQWVREYGVVAGVTGRGGGFDLNLWSRDSVGSVMTRWRTLKQTLGAPFPTAVVSHQRHGDAVATVAHRTDGLVIRDGFDGHATLVPGVMLLVTVADCVPVYLVHPPSGALALLHAGWRGIAGGILARGVERLADLARADVADIVMHCGVSICGQCYEVGPEVIEGVTGRPAGRPGLLDLRATLLRQGEALGIRQATSSGWCTVHHPDRFYSYRRSGGASGRMVAYLGRPLA